MNKNRMPDSRLALRRALCAMAAAALCVPSIAHAKPIMTKDPGTKITVYNNGVYSSPFNLSDGAPKGANFTVTADGAVYTITSSVKNHEPRLAAAMSQGVQYIAGTAGPTVPGEIGYASLVDDGPITDLSSGGSTVSVGIVGGYTASYTTKAGDSVLTIDDNLVSSLDANGVDAFISGTTLELISSISDPTTLDGAVSMESADPAFEFEMDVGTVPDETSTLTLFGPGACLLACVGRRRKAKA
jgi:hypothetical protein